jgi:hypothetical protein
MLGVPMRLLVLTLCLCACANSPIADPGAAVGKTHDAALGSFVLSSCLSALEGDDGGSGWAMYVVSPEGAVSRWVPDALPGGTDFLSSAATPALFMDAQLKLWSLLPNGTVQLVDESPGREESRFGADGAHRLVTVEKKAQWRNLDGGVERTFTFPDFAHHLYPSPNGERAIAQMNDDTVLVDERGVSVVLALQTLYTAAWSPDGKEVAIATIPVVNGAQPLDERGMLWRAKLDGTAPVQLPLPARPGPGLIDRVLGVPQYATAVHGVVWAKEGLVILSNHESKCWWGGRDLSSGCEWALYRLAPEGGAPKRLSPRAFQCQQMFQLR